LQLKVVKVKNKRSVHSVHGSHFTTADQGLFGAPFRQTRSGAISLLPVVDLPEILWPPSGMLLRADDTFGSVDMTVWHFGIEYPTNHGAFV
jgi:hypothetical protein